MIIIDDDSEGIFVICTANEINTNNNSHSSPYSLIDGTTGVPYSPDEELERLIKTTPTCADCCRRFATFSDLFKHRAHPCALWTEGKDSITHPVRIHFDESQLKVIEDFLLRNLLQVHDIRNETIASDCRSSETPCPPSPPRPFYVIWEASRIKYFLRLLYFVEVEHFTIENWYNLLMQNPAILATARPHKNITAPTIFIPLTDDDLKIIQKLFTMRKFGTSSTLAKSDMNLLSDLESRIRSAMRPGQSYFCRLSTRSPKDGATTTASNDPTPEQRLHNKNLSLKVSSPQQLTELLARSERVFADIVNFMTFREAFRGTKMNLILREWMEDLRPEHEFRCFVNNQGNLTCISQYHCYDVFESLQNRDYVERIRDAICSFHAQVGPVLSRVSPTGYVVDVHVQPSSPEFIVQIIELNPFGAHMSSGSGLFNWQTDQHILYGDHNYSDHPQPHIRVLKQLAQE